MKVSSILNLLGNDVKKDTLDLVKKECNICVNVPTSTSKEKYYYSPNQEMFFVPVERICIIDNAVYLEYSGIIDCIEADHICSIHLKKHESVGF